MKLTESQLKRIIAEEVQIAIDEGLFDKISGAVKGAAGYLGGKAAGAAKKAGSALAGAAYSAADKVATGVDRGLDAIGQGIEDTVGAGLHGIAKGVNVAKQGAQAVKKGVEATTAAAKAGAEQAEKASVVRQQRAAVEQASALVNNLSRIFDKVSTAEDGKQQIMNMINTLAVNAKIDLAELAKSVASSQAAGKETLANAPRSARGPEGAGQVTSRIGAGVRSMPGYGSMEEQADAITEAILKRIIQKR